MGVASSKKRTKRKGTGLNGYRNSFTSVKNSFRVDTVQITDEIIQRNDHHADLEKRFFVNEDRYRMNHRKRGYAIIISNKIFQPRTNLSTRYGTDVDAESLSLALTRLGFTVQVHDDLTALEMLTITEKLSSKLNHSDCDAFVCAVLSHGEDGTVYGTDKAVDVEQITSAFKRSSGLYGKPKLFIFQACRGSMLMESIEKCYDAIPVNYVPRIPLEADFLLAYSTVPGYLSWRNSHEGSWFIQSVCHVLNEYGTSLEIMALFTRINRRVAFEYSSNVSAAEDQALLKERRQVPCIVSMLTKELYLKPKQHTSFVNHSPDAHRHVQLPSSASCMQLIVVNPSDFQRRKKTATSSPLRPPPRPPKTNGLPLTYKLQLLQQAISNNNSNNNNDNNDNNNDDDSNNNDNNNYNNGILYDRMC